MNRQQGFTLVSAIFLLVVLAVMGTSLVTLGSVQHASAARDAQALRAYYAAKTGLEWAASRSLAGDCPATRSFVLNEGALAGFEVTVRCTATSHALGAASTPYYVAEASARSGQYGSHDFVARRVQSKLLVGP